MVPAADAKISQAAMDETFYLSNIAPQVGDGFNRHCESPLSWSLSHESALVTGLYEWYELINRLGIPRGLLSKAHHQF